MDEYYNMMRMNEEIMERKDEEEIHKLRNDLKNYNMLDFLKKVSALMLFPINQSKSVIFQCMISTALSIPKDEINNSNNMSIGKFRKIVKHSFFDNLHFIIGWWVVCDVSYFIEDSFQNFFGIFVRTF